MGTAAEKRQERLRKKRHRQILKLLFLGLCLILAVILSVVVLRNGKGGEPKTAERAAATVSAPEAERMPELASSDGPSMEETGYDAVISPETYEAPAVESTSAAASEPVTLIFTGDVLLEGKTLANYQNAGASGLLSESLLAELRNADILMINEEFPFSLRGEMAPDKQYTFRTDPAYVTAFQDMGVDIAGLANNHILDFGTDALLDSCATLENAGILYAGAGADLSRAKALQVIEAGGKKFGFLAASRVWPVASWAAGEGHPGVFGTYDPTLLLSAIQEARPLVDYLTVFVHWGIERSPVPEEYQRSLAQQYVLSGADLVIGMHPHVLQGAEVIGTSPVFYSLGNFIFGGRSYETAVVKVTVPPEGSPEIRVLPCMAGGGTTRLAEGNEALTIFTEMNAVSFGAVLDETGRLTIVQPDFEGN